ncbi:hypothetical protein JW865_04155 [Candidatus Bathyarchaeota archaeon]|nr:hypothetical protein [Candidatus Bathyarchaeota archaeon]
MSLSDVFQEKFNKKECPFLLECDLEVVKHFYNQICKTTKYKNCNYFAKRSGELHRPIFWLQRNAIDESYYINEINTKKEDIKE